MSAAQTVPADGLQHAAGHVPPPVRHGSQAVSVDWRDADDGVEHCVYHALSATCERAARRIAGRMEWARMAEGVCAGRGSGLGSRTAGGDGCCTCRARRLLGWMRWAFECGEVMGVLFMREVRSGMQARSVVNDVGTARRTGREGVIWGGMWTV